MKISIKLFFIFIFQLLVLNSFGQIDSEFGEAPIKDSLTTLIKRDNHRTQFPNIILRSNPMALLLTSEIPILTSEWKVESEFSVGPKSGLVLGASYLSMGPVLRTVIDQDTSLAHSGYTSNSFAMIGYRVQFGYRYYPKRKKPNEAGYKPAPFGFYLYPRFSYANSILFLRQNRTDQIRIQFMNVTLNSGYQFLIANFVALDIYFGLGYKKNELFEQNRTNTKKITDQELQDLFIIGSPIKINLGTSIGIAF